MKVLIVDGNEKSASDRYTELGMLTQYEVYKKVLENITDIELEIIVIHPANFNDFLPKGINLDDFDGIVWTGSVLNIYDYSPSIERQIDLAKNLFTKEYKKILCPNILWKNLHYVLVALEYYKLVRHHYSHLRMCKILIHLPSFS